MKKKPKRLAIDVVEDIVTITLQQHGYCSNVARAVAKQIAARAGLVMMKYHSVKNMESMIDWLDAEIAAFEEVLIPEGGLH
jgi:hypothetical protein